jgi:hypothetical protein
VLIPDSSLNVATWIPSTWITKVDALITVGLPLATAIFPSPLSTRNAANAAVVVLVLVFVLLVLVLLVLLPLLRAAPGAGRRRLSRRRRPG